MTKRTANSQPGCAFCRIACGQEASDILYQDDLVTAFRDIHPQAPTHILIIPNRHIPAIASTQYSDGELLSRMIAIANHIATKEGIAQTGYRLVINNGPQAGQSVYHLHLHLLGGRRMGWPPG